MKSSANLNLYLWNPDAFQAYGVEFVVMMFNATFNNISIISQRSVLLVEDTGENHRSAQIADLNVYVIKVYKME